MSVTRHRVGTRDEFDDGFRKVLTIDDREIIVLRENDRFYAFDNWCPHQGGPVGEGVVVGKTCMLVGEGGAWEGDRFSETLHLVCPWHGWEYELDTGVFAGDDSVRLQPHDVVEEGDEVFVVCQDHRGGQPA